MAGGDVYVDVNGYRWRMVNNETTAGKVYDIRDVQKAGGDQSRINTVTS